MLHDLLPASRLLGAFVAASLVLAITPGPGVLYIVTRSVAQGRAAGLASVAGVALGNLTNAIGAAIGLAAVFALSSTTFVLVKYAGAAYLIYLGIKTLRTSAPRVTPHAAPPVDTRRLFRDGLVVAVLNPKTTVFFAAFLPQFMSPNVSPIAQGIALGALFVLIAALTDSVYAMAAGTIAARLRRARGMQRLGRLVIGSTFIGLGLFTALGGSRQTST